MSVLLETSQGDLTVDLYVEDCPNACKNFLKLCKIKYYNHCLFHNVQKDFIAQTGDPTGTGRGGESIFAKLYGQQARYFDDEIRKHLKHNKLGLLCMASNGPNTNASQFYFTLTDRHLDYLDETHTIFGEVGEGFDTLDRINNAYVDENGKPFQNIRIKHTIILEDPFPDPAGLPIPENSPIPPMEDMKGDRIEDDVDVKGNKIKDPEEFETRVKKREAYSRAVVLQMVGDLPDANVKPPDNVLFVCKLNPVTEASDLEIIFGRFGRCKADIIKDRKTGDSLCYGFIEFDKDEQCLNAYYKMDNVLIDDRRIHVDFCQSVAKLWGKWKRGDRTFIDPAMYKTAKEMDEEVKKKKEMEMRLRKMQMGGKENKGYDMVFSEEEEEVEVEKEGNSNKRKRKRRRSLSSSSSESRSRSPSRGRKKRRNSSREKDRRKSKRRSRSRDRDRDRRHSSEKSRNHSTRSNRRHSRDGEKRRSRSRSRDKERRRR